MPLTIDDCRRCWRLTGDETLLHKPVPGTTGKWRRMEGAGAVNGRMFLIGPSGSLYSVPERAAMDFVSGRIREDEFDKSCQMVTHRRARSLSAVVVLNRGGWRDGARSKVRQVPFLSPQPGVDPLPPVAQKALPSPKGKPTFARDGDDYVRIETDGTRGVLMPWAEAIKTMSPARRAELESEEINTELAGSQ